MGEKKQINIQVNEEKKEQWENYAESNLEAANLSHLIRTAVQKEVNGRETPSVGQQSNDNSEVIQAVNQLERKIDEIGDRLTPLEQFVESKTTEYSLEHRVNSALPPAKPHSKKWERATNRNPTHLGNVAWSGKISEIAEVADTNEEDALEAIKGLEQTPVSIYSDVVDGEKRFWGEE